ncbi:ABC transporter ATP-binding protein [Parapusillimonas sp. JC17]|uniref:ABC transporter ATP-binding protein n=1 Tax=Parapusillimonas sp. JC17 TaxID=3445768 RepID=UPI003FA12E4E
MDALASAQTLIAKGVSCRFGSLQVLDDLDLPPLPPGQVVALLGPNGSGKSTLLKSLAGLVPARFHALSVGHRDMLAQPERARADILRYLPQSLPEALHLTVTESLLVALNVRRRPGKAQAMERSIAVLESLGIAALAPKYLDALSGGQKQLVGLAQTLVDQPDVLLLDEPLASLDLNYQHHVMGLLGRLARERNMLIIIVVHDLDMALRYADTALLLHQGGLLAAGPPKTVITPEHLAHAFKVQARIQVVRGGHATVFVDDLIQL